MSNSEMRSVTRRWVKGTMPVLRHNSRYVVYTSPVVSFGFPISSFNRIPRRMTFDCVGRLFTASITVSSSILFFARWTCSSVMCSSPWRSASSALTRRRSRARRASPCSWAASAAIRWSTPSSAVPFGKDVEQFVRVVRRKDHLLVREAGPHPRIEIFGELEIVRDPDDRDAGLREVVVDLQELVEDVVPVLLDDLVDLIEGDDHDALLLVELLPEEVVHPVRGKACERDPLVEVLDQLVPD